jgi:hypothetical protein
VKAIKSVRLWIGTLAVVLLLAACGAAAAGVISSQPASSHPNLVTTNAGTHNAAGSATEREAPAEAPPVEQSEPAAPAPVPNFPNIKSGGPLPEPGGCGTVFPQRPSPKLPCASPE